MSRSIFTVNEATGECHSIPLARFAKEDDFQALLEKYPHLLTSDAITPGSPRRWIQLEREKGVSLSPDSGSSLSLDHLFVDQDGIPTLVEVKRAENLELRRKVVAQMLDYAANAVEYWPPDGLRHSFEAKAGTDPTATLVETLEIPPDEIDDFWRKVGSNLKSGRIRMLFVADEIPRELKRIVEFLNEQMNPAEILALELQQFTAGPLRTIVPTVFGQTERAAQGNKPSKTSAKLDERQLRSLLTAAVPAGTAHALERLFEYANVEPFRLRTAEKSLYFGCVNREGAVVEPFCLSLDRRLWAQFGKFESPFDTTEFKEELRQEMNRIPGIQLTGAEQYPTSSMSKFSPETVEGLQRLLDWVRARIEQSEKS